MSLREGVDKQEIGAFSSVAGFMDTQLTLTGGGEARRVEATRVDAKFFDVLGVQPAIGRTFDRAENQPATRKSPCSATRCGSSSSTATPRVLGRAILLNGIPHTRDWRDAGRLRRAEPMRAVAAAAVRRVLFGRYHRKQEGQRIMYE